MSTSDHPPPPPPTKNHRLQRRLLCITSCTLMAVGTVGGPLLIRLYFSHGGSRKWLSSWLQTAAFPIILLPLSFIYSSSSSASSPFFAEPRLVFASAVIGLISGLTNFLYSDGLSYLPVSTSSLLYSTQLPFTAVFAFFMVKQRFSFCSVNTVALMTLGAVLLAIRKDGDRPPGVSGSQYTVGFVVTVLSAALLGLIFPCIQFSYAKAKRVITYAVVLQFQLGVSVFATVFCTVGMLANHDFAAIPREAKAYDLGETKYYIVLVATAVLWQFSFIGTAGTIFYTSSLFAGVYTALLLPFTEVAAVIAFRESFSGEKGMAMALCLWGFVSYFYGVYKEGKGPPMTTSETAKEAEMGETRGPEDAV
ncbi:Purine permease 3 [Acorus gramineus]|uniref:Probable purine permease n=1 Tax=Acorus gramineus TaxID=55184 RepID=A0AAV9BVL2_ACOGR|nr:Purine permease 3 [Acorus gramineus]